MIKGFGEGNSGGNWVVEEEFDERVGLRKESRKVFFESIT